MPDHQPSPTLSASIVAPVLLAGHESDTPAGVMQHG